MKEITIAKAKKVIKAVLDKHDLPYTKLTGRTVGFADLARTTCIFVTVHGWRPSPMWSELEKAAFEHGFCVNV